MLAPAAISDTLGAQGAWLSCSMPAGLVLRTPSQDRSPGVPRGLGFSQDRDLDGKSQTGGQGVPEPGRTGGL